ncbi:membrane protein [Planctomycetota bacterium]|nr:membrane protein [Planctomycetota bacterium]
MSHPLTFSCAVPEAGSADLVVVGGGPSGFAAALTARRQGLSVILLERSAQLGGAGTLAGVSVWMPIGVITGIYQEVTSGLGMRDWRGRDFAETGKFSPHFDPAVVRHHLDHQLVTAGVEVLFHCTTVGVTVVDGRVEAVIASTPEGLRAFRGRAFVDATGDASVCRAAGVPCVSGRSEDGLTQPMTLMFQMQDTGRPQRMQLPPSVPRYDRVEDLPQGRLLHWLDAEHGTLLVNMTRVRGNGAMLRERSAAEREGLRQALGVAEYLQRTSHPTFVVSSIAAEIGVRETWQIIAKYRMEDADVVEGRRQPDAVCQSNYGIDIHNPSGAAGTHQPQELAPGQRPPLYDIPWRSLVPDSGPANLCVAGRCLGASHVAMSAARVQPACMGMGQGAGTAIAIALEHGLPLADVPSGWLRQRLEGQGVRFVV